MVGTPDLVERKAVEDGEREAGGERVGAREQLEERLLDAQVEVVLDGLERGAETVVGAGGDDDLEPRGERRALEDPPQ